MRVSETPTLDLSLLSTGYPYDIRKIRDNNLAEHAAFMVRCRSVREMGSAAINLALVAAGRLDAFWELKLGSWDVAAGCPWSRRREAARRIPRVVPWTSIRRQSSRPTGESTARCWQLSERSAVRRRARSVARRL
jgi:Inositol monophosphatase family